jgi:tetratricopeptide (TPR) repeat protein
MKHHKELTLDKWKSFSLAQRILMVATEFLRAKSAIAKGDLREAIDSYERALELLDLTIATARGNLLGELLRFREVLALSYYKKDFRQDVNQRLYEVLVSLNKDAYNMVN